MYIDVDSDEGNALFDALLFTDEDTRLSRIYAELGLRPDDNGTVHLIP